MAVNAFIPTRDARYHSQYGHPCWYSAVVVRTDVRYDGLAEGRLRVLFTRENQAEAPLQREDINRVLGHHVCPCYADRELLCCDT